MAEANPISEIFDPGSPLRAASLASLSALEPEERRRFAALAPAAPAERRLTIAQRLVDLAEDDATLDFSGAFVELLSDADPAVRRIAIDGLWEYEQRDLIQPLIQ